MIPMYLYAKYWLTPGKRWRSPREKPVKTWIEIVY
jgi:hypothetical protein